MKRILVINPGATSTKIAVYEDENEVMRVGIDHDAAEMDKHEKIVDQMPFRRDIIMKTLEEKGFKLEDFDAICGRGGLLKHIPSGTYKVTWVPTFPRNWQTKLASRHSSLTRLPLTSWKTLLVTPV